MRKNKMWMAAVCGSMMMALAVTGCQAKTPAAQAGNTAAVESQTESSKETMAESASDAEGAGQDKESGSDGAAAEQTEAAEKAAAAVADDIIRVWGPVLSVDEGSILIDNKDENSAQGEMVLNIDPEKTKVLDAINGFPVALEDLNKDEVIYAYIGPAMTMSLPPMVNAEAVICQVPQDAPAPEYVHVKTMEMQKDDSYLLTASDGTSYQVPADCEILPFLTRNIVTLTDVQTGSKCLVWGDGYGSVLKIVLFAE